MFALVISLSQSYSIFLEHNPHLKMTSGSSAGKVKLAHIQVNISYNFTIKAHTRTQFSLGIAA